METKTIKPKNIASVKELKAALEKISRQHTGYVTATVTFGDVTVYVNSHKPQSLDTDTEYMIREFGGFFKDGKIVPASKSLMAKFYFCPILR